VIALLRSIFTEHLATKFMSLLLAFVLFAVVQQQIIGDRVIDEIQLEFKLAQELDLKYTLMSPTVPVLATEIRGQIREVDDVVKGFRSQKARDILVDQRLLSRYGEGETAIKITPQFLLEHELLPAGTVRVVGGPSGDPRLRIQPNVDQKLELTMAKGMREHTALRKDSDYEGTLDNNTRVDIRFMVVREGEPRQLTELRVLAPASAFGQDHPQKLFARFPDINEYLADGRVRVEGYDWQPSGIGQPDIFERYARCYLDGVWVRFADLEIFATFVIHPRKVDTKLDLRIVYQVRQADRSFLDDHAEVGPEGPVNWPGGQAAAGIAKAFVVSYSRAEVKDPEKDLDSLEIVLDIAGRRTDGDRILVPVFLRVDRAKAYLVDDGHVRIKMAVGKQGPAYVVFSRKE